MDYVKVFLAPFLKDKAIWIALSTWALKLANSKLGLGMDDNMLTTAAGVVSAWAVTHVSHLKAFGGDGKASEDVK